MRIAVLLLVLLSGVSYAQTEPEGVAIMKPITQLFTGMNLGDSAMVHGAFTSSVTMATISIDKSGKTSLVRENSLTNFLKAVGSPHAEPWSEPIWDVNIQQDGLLAQVWAKYAFYAGTKFSHCGVDAFQLVKENGAWKIFHLTDTRQREGCNVPTYVSDVFKK
jgi:hypothetical protein